jgi:hypothetical protein
MMLGLFGVSLWHAIEGSLLFLVMLASADLACGAVYPDQPTPARPDGAGLQAQANKAGPCPIA